MTWSDLESKQPNLPILVPDFVPETDCRVVFPFSPTVSFCKPFENLLHKSTAAKGLQSFDFCSLLLDEEGIVVALFGDGVVLRFARIFLFRVRCSFTLQFFKHLLNLCQNCGEGTFWKSILNLRSYQCEPNTLGLLSLCLQDFKGALQFQGRTGRTGRTQLQERPFESLALDTRISLFRN